MYYVLFSRSVQDKSKETRASVGYKSPTTDTAAALHCLLLLFTQYELVSIQYLNFSLGIKTYVLIKTNANYVYTIFGPLSSVSQFQLPPLNE